MDELDHHDLHEQLKQQVPRNVEEQGRFRGILCGACTYGLLYRRKGKLEVTVRCNAGEGSRLVPPDIAECSDYNEKNALTLWDMTKMALKIDVRKAGGQYL